MDLKRITAEEAKGLIEKEGYTLLDVRSIPEYSDEHAQGAFNVPFLHKAPHGMVPNQDFARVVQGLFPDRNAKLITTCQMGGRSIRAAMELTNLGYTQVIDLRGGFGSERDDSGKVVVKGWREAGLPTEKGETPGHNYRELATKVSGGPAASPAEPAHQGSAAPAAAACATEPASSHAGHSHGHDAPAKLNRFADPTRTVMCVKFGRELPALKRKPFGGPLGDRVKNEISAQAWEMWVEHSKLLINEYRLNPADAKSQELLMKQCEEYLFGEDAKLPEGFVPQMHTK